MDSGPRPIDEDSSIHYLSCSISNGNRRYVIVAEQKSLAKATTRSSSRLAACHHTLAKAVSEPGHLSLS